MILSGWGNYPKIACQVTAPRSVAEVAKIVAQNELIARGNGRAYGDSALNRHCTMNMQSLHHFVSFDDKHGILHVDAGVQLRAIMDALVPRGWFLPVTPGTSYVTVGGAIASDVHGKNHHGAGTFGQHILAMQMLLGTGDIITVSPQENADLFHATCGGMGLTGVILSATLKMLPITSSMIHQTVVKTVGLEDICEQFDLHADKVYSVAWVDCLASDKNFGRAVFMFGDHARRGALTVSSGERFAVPVDAPAMLLNRLAMTSFNKLYYARAKTGQSANISLPQYFYPLDKIGSWNRLYGKSGFIQYQFVVPRTDGVANVKKILKHIANSGHGAYLAVLKLFGEKNQNLLSFPISGYTMAMDFRLGPDLPRFIATLDDMIVDMGGRLYLAKDAMMSARNFKRSYPQWEKFETVREKFGAIGKFSSVQSKRLDLT